MSDFDETQLKTTDDQLGHLIMKAENCRTQIVQKLDLPALKNLVKDHLFMLQTLQQTDCHSEPTGEESPEESPAAQTAPPIGGGTRTEEPAEPQEDIQEDMQEEPQQQETAEDITPAATDSAAAQEKTLPEEITHHPFGRPGKITIIIE